MIYPHIMNASSLDCLTVGVSYPMSTCCSCYTDFFCTYTLYSDHKLYAGAHVSTTSSWWLKMSWCQIGARTSATSMMALLHIVAFYMLYGSCRAAYIMPQRLNKFPARLWHHQAGDSHVTAGWVFSKSVTVMTFQMSSAYSALQCMKWPLAQFDLILAWASWKLLWAT